MLARVPSVPRVLSRCGRLPHHGEREHSKRHRYLLEAEHLDDDDVRKPAKLP